MLFIYNPKAGKALIRNHLVDILDVFVKGGYEVTVYPTQARGDAIKKTKKKKDKYDIVVCSGGDGTLDEVFTGMMETKVKVPIGYIPAGSTNDFAASLNLSKNMVQAAEDIVNGDTFAVDVGLFNEDIFAYIAAFGLFVSWFIRLEKFLEEGIACQPSFLRDSFCLGQFLVVYHRSLAQTLESTVNPFGIISTGKGVCIKRQLEKAEPFGIGLQAQIAVGLGSIGIICRAHNVDIIKQALALGNELVHRAGKYRHEAQKHKQNLSYRHYYTQF